VGEYGAASDAVGGVILAEILAVQKQEIGSVICLPADAANAPAGVAGRRPGGRPRRHFFTRRSVQSSTPSPGSNEDGPRVDEAHSISCLCMW